MNSLPSVVAALSVEDTLAGSGLSIVPYCGGCAAVSAPLESTVIGFIHTKSGSSTHAQPHTQISATH